MSIDLKKKEKVDLKKSAIPLPENERSFLQKLMIPGGLVLAATGIFLLWPSLSNSINDKNTSSAPVENTAIDDNRSQEVIASQTILKDNNLDTNSSKSIIVYFSSNDDILSKAEVEKIKSTSLNGKEISVVNAYCDQRGDKAYNKQLANKRLQAVKKYLPSDSYDANAIGSEELVCNENSEECYTKNRRVEIKFK